MAGKVRFTRPLRANGAASAVAVYRERTPEGKARLRAIALIGPKIGIGRGKIPRESRMLLAQGEQLFKSQGGNLEKISDLPGKPAQVRARLEASPGGKPLRVILGKGSFPKTELGIEASKTLSERVLHAGIRTGELDSLLVHGLASGASVLKVGNSILVPQRSGQTRPTALAGKIHFVGGRVKGRQKPHGAAREEVSLETGIPEHGIRIPPRGKKQLPAVLSRETRENFYTALYDMVVTVPEEKVFTKYFRRNPDGTYQTTMAPEKFEATRWFRVPNNRAGITEFLRANAERISPTMQIVLNAHLMKLKS